MIVSLLLVLALSTSAQALPFLALGSLGDLIRHKTSIWTVSPRFHQPFHRRGQFLAHWCFLAPPWHPWQVFA